MYIYIYKAEERERKRERVNVYLDRFSVYMCVRVYGIS